MPNYPPPAALPRTPTKATLPAGTPVYRVHGSHRSATEFKAVPSPAFYEGGRFDSTPYHPYGFLYLGFGVGAAVSEVLLRDMPFDGTGAWRVLPRVRTARLCLSFLRLAADLELVSLMSGADLAAVGQDSWLIHADSREYPQTRDWGHWIRERTGPWAQGFVWPSKREPADRVAVLFEDRCPVPPLEPAGPPPVTFGTEDGERWLNGVLAPYCATVAPRPGAPEHEESLAATGSPEYRGG
ncbi:RES family NAD+ phosphorylase [Streptomyces sp. TRM S81-3]|uniref:RES family NAD+ phosphorylase n=1 Tax=Streptomyces griseicoloratus TaxID=2752516 RepID=A0A926QUT5_9ACTN|nr:RES family NAD+ phosphorylase [Streptomyces griseicoloratus]MBD0424523.1 RES family NAD+ phosphorylase [Streptomyces griseicoloratus]